MFSLLKIDEVIWKWGILYNEELYNLYRSTGIVSTVKSKKSQQDIQITQMGKT
jgi:hypothetical protein